MLYLLIIFLSAFLLFQVQPLIAKLILPLFGGGSAIWTACLLFFQAFLLLGYLYAHLVSQINSVKRQALLHSGVVFISLFLLPIGISPNLNTVNEFSPLTHILLLLATSVGLPYFILSSTGPLLQRWLSLHQEHKLPYKLYSLSNVGSLLALLSFPFVFEPLLSASLQTYYWSTAYIVFVALMLTLTFKLSRYDFNVSTSEKNKERKDAVAFSRKSLAQPILWLLLSAIGVVVLVATTNAMTQNIPPVPFLWILPLCLYLLSFIISFHSPKWYVRWFWLIAFLLTAFIALLMFFIGSQFDIVTQIVLYSCILFVACMICHGELASLKPEVERLTLFYLVMSLGGFLGSAFVAFVAQNLFTQFFEFPLAMIATFLLLAFSLFIQEKRVTALLTTSVAAAVLMTMSFWYLNQSFVKTNVTSERNFYGILSVKDVEINGKWQRRLIDGSTSHGTQSLEENESQIPLSYYRENTGVALAIEQVRRGKKQQGVSSNLSIGFIGLGAGTLAAYGKKGDKFRFYELNPTVVSTAQEYFSYLADSKAEIDIVLGDGRVSLKDELIKQGSRRFDLLVIDAFSGDSIPQHLLTVEALALYFKHLNNDGVLAIHISNSHLNLLPLIHGLSNYLGLFNHHIKTLAQSNDEHDTQWALLTGNKGFHQSAVIKAYSTKVRGNELSEKEVLWTDDSGDLMSVLK